jgi:hypothetical protein
VSVRSAERALPAQAEELDAQIAHKQIVIDDQHRLFRLLDGAPSPGCLSMGFGSAARLTASTRLSKDKPLRMKPVTRSARAWSSCSSVASPHTMVTGAPGLIARSSCSTVNPAISGRRKPKSVTLGACFRNNATASLPLVVEMTLYPWRVSTFCK